ncbi:hypothetical protein pb186bvf_005083 [Paramecium bursaria]
MTMESEGEVNDKMQEYDETTDEKFYQKALSLLQDNQAIIKRSKYGYTTRRLKQNKVQLKNKQFRIKKYAVAQDRLRPDQMEQFWEVHDQAEGPRGERSTFINGYLESLCPRYTFGDVLQPIRVIKIENNKWVSGKTIEFQNGIINLVQIWDSDSGRDLRGLQERILFLKKNPQLKDQVRFIGLNVDSGFPELIKKIRQNKLDSIEQYKLENMFEDFFIDMLGLREIENPQDQTPFTILTNKFGQIAYMGQQIEFSLLAKIESLLKEEELIDKQEVVDDLLFVSSLCQTSFKELPEAKIQAAKEIKSVFMNEFYRMCEEFSLNKGYYRAKFIKKNMMLKENGQLKKIKLFRSNLEVKYLAQGPDKVRVKNFHQQVENVFEAPNINLKQKIIYEREEERIKFQDKLIEVLDFYEIEPKIQNVQVLDFLYPKPEKKQQVSFKAFTVAKNLFTYETFLLIKEDLENYIKSEVYDRNTKYLSEVSLDRYLKRGFQYDKGDQMFKINNFRRLVNQDEIFVHMEYQPFELIGLQGYLSIIDDHDFPEDNDKSVQYDVKGAVLENLNDNHQKFTGQMIVNDKILKVEGILIKYEGQKEFNCRAQEIQKEQIIKNNQGQVTIYLIFNPWDTTSQSLVSQLRELCVQNQQWKDKVRFICIACNQAETSEQFIEENQKSHKILEIYYSLEKYTKLQKMFYSKQLPYTVVVDQNGFIKRVGNDINLKQIINQLINHIPLVQHDYQKEQMVQVKKFLYNYKFEEYQNHEIQINFYFQGYLTKENEYLYSDMPFLKYFIRNNKQDKFQDFLNYLFKIIPENQINIQSNVSKVVEIQFGKECVLCKTQLDENTQQYHSPFKDEHLCVQCAEFDDKTKLGLQRYKYTDTLVFINAPLIDISNLKNIDKYRYGRNLKLDDDLPGDQFHNICCDGCGENSEGPRYILFQKNPGPPAPIQDICSDCFQRYKIRDPALMESFEQNEKDISFDQPLLRILFDLGYKDY